MVLEIGFGGGLTPGWKEALCLFLGRASLVISPRVQVSKNESCSLGAVTQCCSRRAQGPLSLAA
jgi:hypothetical protein